MTREEQLEAALRPFAKAFHRTQIRVVHINAGRPPEARIQFASQEWREIMADHIAPTWFEADEKAMSAGPEYWGCPHCGMPDVNGHRQFCAGAAE